MLIADEEHFKQLFDAHYAELCATAYPIVKSHDKAEDIVQNFFMRLWQHRDKINIVHSFRTYSIKAVYLMALNHLRQQSRGMQYTDISEHPEISSPSLDAKWIEEKEKEHSKLLDEIDRIIESLPEKNRQIFKMAHYQQMRHAAIAAQLGISVNTVKVQVSRAYKTIRLTLGKQHLSYLVILFAPVII